MLKRSNKKTFTQILFSIIFLLIFINSQVISQTLLDPNAEVEEIASGILQPEGPVWKDSLGLLFSDIKGNEIYRWTAEKGKEVGPLAAVT